MRHRACFLLIACALSVSAACMDRLPDQDLRILSATPVARLSADILWQEYQADRDAADRNYWGKPIVVTGTVTATGAADVPTDGYVLFGQDETFGVRANLLEDQAVAIMAEVAPDRRLTLKCFCEGLSGHVVLKSCVKP
jgi:hypothetical protein